jgi:NitT/TauT family transport system substrate-binding protein
LTTRKATIEKFMKAYRETIDWLYSSDDALKVYSEWINIPVSKLKRTRDEYFTKAAVDPDKIVGVEIIVKDAVTLKFTATELTKEQLAELIQIPPR